MKEESTKTQLVTIKVVPSEILEEAFETKLEKIKDVSEDDYFAGFTAALHYASVLITKHEVDVPTSVLTKQKE